MTYSGSHEQGRPRFPRAHPAASTASARLAARQESIRTTARVKPRSIEEAKLNLRVAAARTQGNSHAGGSMGTDLTASAIQFVKAHPAALAAGVGVIAMVVGPGKLIKGAAMAARLATVAGVIGKAAK
ncbi:MAG: hypothetical protein ACIAS6_01455 [Phycisphaerales bacterium JB060]